MKSIHTGNKGSILQELSSAFHKKSNKSKAISPLNFGSYHNKPVSYKYKVNSKTIIKKPAIITYHDKAASLANIDLNNSKSNIKSDSNASIITCKNVSKEKSIISKSHSRASCNEEVDKSKEYPSHHRNQTSLTGGDFKKMKLALHSVQKAKQSHCNMNNSYSEKPVTYTMQDIRVSLNNCNVTASYDNIPAGENILSLDLVAIKQIEKEIREIKLRNQPENAKTLAILNVKS